MKVLFVAVLGVEASCLQSFDLGEFSSTQHASVTQLLLLTLHRCVTCHAVSQDIPPMREGGKRYVVASPGPMQRQGTKSLLWVVGLSQALEEAGGKRPRGYIEMF
jgi:hypothetical protein